MAVPFDTVDEAVVVDMPMITGTVVTLGTIMNVELAIVVRPGIDGSMAISVLDGGLLLVVVGVS